MIGRFKGRLALLAALAVAAAAVVAALGSSTATSATGFVTYSATVNVPAPPASTFAGANGGGDGWAVGLTSTQVFNVFHHQPTTVVNCHNQSDASACWSGPKIVVDGSGHNFSTSIGPGLFVSQDTGKLYTTVVRTSDDTAGVLCIDTTKPADATGAELYCGFTALTPAGDGSGNAFDANGLSAPVQVGSKWYFVNEVRGTPTGQQGKMLCFDLTTKAACAGQPYPLDRGGSNWVNGTYSYPIGASGSKIFVQISSNPAKLACFDTTNPTVGTCGGSWPVTAGNIGGAPFPMLDAAGTPIGICQRVGSLQCFDLSGNAASAPAGMAAAIAPTVEYSGPAAVIGPRVYVPVASSTAVACYDYAAAAGCASFPKSFGNMYLLYSVNPDPQRPTCLWVNADQGSGQIQSFDAYTGGACGSGAIRVLASSILVPTEQCIPTAYTSLQVLTPARSTYSDGKVDFEDVSGNPLAGVSSHTLDGTGTVGLTDLNLSTKDAFPQFLITLNNLTTAVGSVEVKLTWEGAYSTDCIKGTTSVDGAAQINTGSGPRAGYCAVAGNVNPYTGRPIPPGTFLDLVLSQPDTDIHYKGAQPSIAVVGKGITCDPPPAGYVQLGKVGLEASTHLDAAGLYALWGPPGTKTT